MHALHAGLPAGEALGLCGDTYIIYRHWTCRHRSLYSQLLNLSFAVTIMSSNQGQIVPLSAAIATSQIEPYKYRADIPLDHCYLKSKRAISAREASEYRLMPITAAHGGLMVCIVIGALKQHFQSSLATRSHPDTFSINTHFLRPAGPGKVFVFIKDIKSGSSVTTIHFALVQDGVERIAGYAS